MKLFVKLPCTMSKIETKLHSNTTSRKLKKKQYRENSLIFFVKSIFSRKLDILIGFFGCCLSSLPTEAGMMAVVILCKFVLAEFLDFVFVVILGILADLLYSAGAAGLFRR